MPAVSLRDAPNTMRPPPSRTSICVFAYGSNMDPDDLNAWCRRRGRPTVRVSRTEVAELCDHRLHFDYWSGVRQGGAANVSPQLATSVFGLALWVDPEGLLSFDLKEGHPNNYERRLLPVRLASGTQESAWVYRVRDEHRRATHIPPTNHYSMLLLNAAKRHCFPASYVTVLNDLCALGSDER